MTKKYTRHASSIKARRARAAIHAELDRRNPDWRKPTHIGSAVRELVRSGHIRAEDLNTREEVEVRSHPTRDGEYVLIHTRRSLETRDAGVPERDFGDAQDVPKKDWMDRASPDAEADTGGILRR